MIPLIEIYCLLDDFCKNFENISKEYFLTKLPKKRNRPCRMSLSEIMTILVMFHMSQYKTFKDFYTSCIMENYRQEFPKLVSYTRFIELMPSAFMPLMVLLLSLKGRQTGKYYIDSTKLPVCHNLRINRNKVFKNCAQRGKTSTGWFFGFKLHIVINNQGEIVNFTLTKGNVHDVTIVDNITQTLKGWLFGDRGYISKALYESLKKRGLELFTTLKSNMKQKILEPMQKQYLKQRNIVETIIGQLKSIMTIDHSRHRSIINFQVNVLGGLLAYVFKPKKASSSFKHLNLISLTSN